MLSNQIILITSPILLLARVARAYDLGSNKSHPLPRGPRLLTLLPLALMMVTVSRSERSLYSLPAPPLGTLCFLVILDHHKIGLVIAVIIFLIVWLMAQLKKVITAITIRMARTLQTKVRPRTTATEVMTVAIWMIMLAIAIAIATRVTRPVGVQGDEDRQPLLVVN